jgi:hypothetical protein
MQQSAFIPLHEENNTFKAVFRKKNRIDMCKSVEVLTRPEGKLSSGLQYA